MSKNQTSLIFLIVILLIVVTVMLAGCSGFAAEPRYTKGDVIWENSSSDIGALILAYESGGDTYAIRGVRNIDGEWYWTTDNKRVKREDIENVMPYKIGYIPDSSSLVWVY